MLLGTDFKNNNIEFYNIKKYFSDNKYHHNLNINFKINIFINSFITNIHIS